METEGSDLRIDKYNFDVTTTCRVLMGTSIVIYGLLNIWHTFLKHEMHNLFNNNIEHNVDPTKLQMMELVKKRDYGSTPDLIAMMDAMPFTTAAIFIRQPFIGTGAQPRMTLHNSLSDIPIRFIKPNWYLRSFSSICFVYIDLVAILQDILEGFIGFPRLRSSSSLLGEMMAHVLNDFQNKPYKLKKNYRKIMI
ncbi:hypothetical protein GQX74_013255 [Glossina fuscipes]|nr:hypothetical protein GQX74_013255 [Glossina fuscipes]